MLISISQKKFKFEVRLSSNTFHIYFKMDTLSSIFPFLSLFGDFVFCFSRYSGPTIHFVDEHYDTGRILAQRVVPVLANDTAEELAARVLHQVIEFGSLQILLHSLISFRTYFCYY